MMKAEQSASDDSLYLSLRSMSLQSLSQDLYKDNKQARLCMKNMAMHLENHSLVDIELISGVDNKRIPAHKLVLSSNSAYFDAMFSSPLIESVAKEIVMHDIDSEILQIMVQYCYTGKIIISEDNVESILSTACLFHLTSVVQACSNFLTKQLDASNCIGFTFFAEQQNCIDLFNNALKYTAAHFMEVCRHQEFAQMTAAQLKLLLENNDLNVDSEEDVFDALIKWTTYGDERKQQIQSILPSLRLTQLSVNFIIQRIEPLCTTMETQKQMLNAFKFMLTPEIRDYTLENSSPRISTVGKLIAIGGMDVNKDNLTIECFDPRVNKWTILKNMPGNCLQFGAGLYQDKLLIIGGRNGLKTLSRVDAIDLQTMTWKTLPTSMATCRHGLGVAILGDGLYAVGGNDGWSYLNTVERYDLVNKTWSFIAPMHTCRSTAGITVFDGKVFAVGGRESSMCHKTVEYYDQHTGKWRYVAPMNKRRGSVSVASLHSYLYAFGGHDAPLTNPACLRTNTIERYDIKTDTWTIIAALDFGRDGMGIGVLGNSLYIVGGYDGRNYLNNSEKFDPNKNEFVSVAPLSHARSGAFVIAIPNGPNYLSGCSSESVFTPEGSATV